jgi:uncharacterized protein with PQ loop repeat
VLIETIGWTAGVYGACIAMPQLARVARNRTTAGIPLLAWQSSFASNLSWTAYGMITGHPNLWLPSLLLTLCAVWMLIMISRDQDADGATVGIRTFGLPAVVAAFAIMVAITVGLMAFTAVVFVPATLAQLIQLRSLITARDISAVSLPFLAMGVISQILWFSWAVLAGDVANELVAGSLIVLSGANLTSYLLRRLALADYDPTATAVEGYPELSPVPSIP